LEIVEASAAAGRARHRRIAISGRILREERIADAERGATRDCRGEKARPAGRLVASRIVAQHGSHLDLSQIANMEVDGNARSIANRFRQLAVS
jgi:hypothetical protein